MAMTARRLCPARNHVYPQAVAAARGQPILIRLIATVEADDARITAKAVHPAGGGRLRMVAMANATTEAKTISHIRMAAGASGRSPRGAMTSARCGGLRFLVPCSVTDPEK